MVGQHIAVWFSCGAASAVAAKLAVEKYGKDNVVSVVNNPVAEEHEDNLRFLNDVAEWLGVPIQLATHDKYPSTKCEDVWRDRKYMAGINGAPCTMILKKQARQQWEIENPVDWHVLGFTAEESKRHDRFTMTERENVLPLLIEAGFTKQDCMDTLVAAGIEPPAIYGMGYPNANCIGCVKATSPTYWNLVRETFPEVFDARAKMSREYGCKLTRHKGKRLFLDELPADAKGAPLKTMNIECGIFCEEKDQ